VRDAFLHLLFPAECLLCRALLASRDAARLVCDVCRHRWRRVHAPWCPRCGQPEPLFGRCRICPDWPPALRGVRSAVWLDGGARRAVHALKYGGLPRIAAELAAVMAALELPGRDTACLVPVPLGPARLRARGYNQSERLARALAAHWRRPVVPLLARVRDTAPQTALTPAERLANVAEAFAVRGPNAGMRCAAASEPPARRVPESVLARPLILVDDVFTTGATLAAAARALERAGARTVQAVTFGRAAIPDFS
jgi:predicted amidophosphoribosyltransferase